MEKVHVVLKKDVDSWTVGVSFRSDVGSVGPGWVDTLETGLWVQDRVLRFNFSKRIVKVGERRYFFKKGLCVV